MSTLYMHIGYHKTATSFLQEVVFPSIPITYLVKPEVDVKGKAVRTWKAFNCSPRLWRSEVGQGIISSLIDNSEYTGGDLLLSDELYIGDISRPEPFLKADGILKKLIPSSSLERIPTSSLIRRKSDSHSLGLHLSKLQETASEFGFSQVKVVLGIRRQDEYLASTYAQVSDRVWGASQKHFERWIHRVLEPSLNYFEGGGALIEYDRYWRNIANYLGENNVLVLPLEMLIKDSSEYLKRLFEFCNMSEVNKHVDDIGIQSVNKRSVSKNSWKLKSIRNPGLRPKRISQMLSKIGIPYKLPLNMLEYSRGNRINLHSGLKKRILDRYAEGNECLDKDVEQVDLKSYGYW